MRWLALVLIAGVAIVLLVVFSTPSGPTLPEAPDEPGRSVAPVEPPVLSHPGLDRICVRRIVGRVVRGGRGVKAEVALRLFVNVRARDHGRGRTDAAGNFVLAGVPPGRHEVSATGPDGVRVRRFVTVPGAVDPAPVELVLPSGELTLNGRAVHEDGRGFSGEVEFEPFGTDDDFFVTTGAGGRFRISGLSAGKVQVGFRAGDAFFAEGPLLTLPHEGELLLVVDEGAQEIRGRVFDFSSGDPIAGAEVRISGHVDGGRCFSVRTKSAADGRFAARVPLDEGRVPGVCVQADGYRPWRLSRFDATGEIEVGLDPSAQFTVRVVDAADGAPVPWVAVKAYFGWQPDVSDSRVQLTDADGVVVFSSIPGDSVRLYVRSNGWLIDNREVPEERRFFGIAPGEEREVELPVRRSPVLKGRVTMAGGDPMEGARVSYETGGLSGNEETGPDGGFLILDLLPGEFSILARYFDMNGDEVIGELVPGEVRDVELSLGAGARLEVGVRAEDTGEPVPGAEVSLDRGPDTRTDAAGMVRLGPLAKGRMIVTIRYAGYRTAVERVELLAGKTSSLAVTLSRGLSVQGKVVREDGVPAAGAEIAWRGGGIGWSRQMTVAAEGGDFLLWGLPSKPIELKATLRVSDDETLKGKGTFPAGTTGAILVVKSKVPEQGRTVRVNVTDGSGGPVPKADFDVMARDADGAPLWVKSREIITGQGAVEVFGDFTDLIVYVHGARRPTSAPLPLGSTVSGPWPPSVSTIDVVLPPERVITGRVLGPDGNGLPRIEVEGSMSAGPRWETMSRYPWGALTGEDGSFRIGGLGEGMVHLEVYAPDDLTQVVPVRVPAGEQGVIIRLDRLVPAVMTVRDSQGRPVDNTWLEAWNPVRIEGGASWQESEAWGRTGPEGRMTFTDLPSAARHILRVKPPKTSGLAPARIDGWVPRDTEVTLSPGLAIAGKVLWSDGTPCLGRHGTVWSWSPARGWDPVALSEAGTFEQRWFEAGRVALVWIPGEENPFDEPDFDPGHYDLPTGWFKAGTEDIEFRLPSR